MYKKVTIYVDADWRTYWASQIDQDTSADHHTVNGQPVVCAGSWYPTQMSLLPYQTAVAKAADLATALLINSQRRMK